MLCNRCLGSTLLSYHTPSEQWQIQCLKCNLLIRNKNKRVCIQQFMNWKEI